MKARGLVGALLGAALLLLSLGSASCPRSCAPDRVDLRGPWGQARLSPQRSWTPETRAPKGLMFRESLPRSAGMLFIYEAPTHRQFLDAQTPFDPAGHDLLLARMARGCAMSITTRLPMDENAHSGR